MIAVLIVFIATNEEKYYDENNIRTRQKRYRYETVLLLATQQQGKLTHNRRIPEQEIKETGTKALKLDTK